METNRTLRNMLETTCIVQARARLTPTLTHVVTYELVTSGADSRRDVSNYLQTKAIYNLLSMCELLTLIYLATNFGGVPIGRSAAVAQSLCALSWALRRDARHRAPSYMAGATWGH